MISTYELSWDTKFQSMTGVDATMWGGMVEKAVYFSKTNKQTTHPNPTQSKTPGEQIRWLQISKRFPLLNIFNYTCTCVLGYIISCTFLRKDGNTFPSKYNSVLNVDLIDLFNILLEVKNMYFPFSNKISNQVKAEAHFMKVPIRVLPKNRLQKLVCFFKWLSIIAVLFPAQHRKHILKIEYIELETIYCLYLLQSTLENKILTLNFFLWSCKVNSDKQNNNKSPWKCAFIW